MSYIFPSRFRDIKVSHSLYFAEYVLTEDFPIGGTQNIGSKEKKRKEKRGEVGSSGSGAKPGKLAGLFG